MKRCLVRSSTTTIRSGLALAALVAAGCDRAPVPPAPRLTLTPESAVLALHGSVRLSATVSGVEADTVVGYHSSDTTVVRVDGTGVARAVGYGSAWAIGQVVTRPALADSARVRVPAPAGPWLVLWPDSLELSTGGYLQLSWRVGNLVDTAGATAVRVTSSDTAIVATRPGGVLCGRRTGAAVVRAELVAPPSAPDSARVRVFQVYDAPASISIQSVVDSAGHVVDPNAVRGTMRVTVHLDTRPASPCYQPPVLTPELGFDGMLWERGPGRDTGGQYTYTFVVDTRAVDAAGQPRLSNGAHTMTAVARGSAGTVLMTTSLSIAVSN